MSLSASQSLQMLVREPFIGVSVRAGGRTFSQAAQFIGTARADRPASSKNEMILGDSTHK